MTSALRIGLFGLLAVGAAASAHASAIKAPAALTHMTREAVQQVIDAYDKGDCDTALALLGPLLADARLAGGPEAVLGWGYGTAASCSYHLRRLDDARRFVVDGTRLAPSNGALWRFRFLLDLERRQLEDAVVTVEGMAERNPAALGTVPQKTLFQLLFIQKEQKQDALRRRLLKVLASDAFTTNEPFSQQDYFRKLYAAILYDEGDKAGALAMIHDVTDPSTLNELSFDPRFAASIPADFDLRAVVERSLADAREKMRQHPDLVEPVVRVSLRLRQLGRPQEALAVLETARSTLARKDGFADAAEQANWWWDDLARTYRMLGRYDDAAAAMLAGADVKEQGQLNVSQVINLAELQLRFGKARESLKTLAAFDKPEMHTSAYGTVAMRTVRACATARLSGASAAAADIAYIRAHEADNWDALAGTLLSLGDLDGAAAALIHQLQDPERTGRTLSFLSDFDDPPVALPPDPEESNLAKVKQRADVKAAIARLGGTRRIHLQNDEL